MWVLKLLCTCKLGRKILHEQKDFGLWSKTRFHVGFSLRSAYRPLDELVILHTPVKIGVKYHMMGRVA